MKFFNSIEFCLTRLAMLVKNVQKLDAIVIGHDINDPSMEKDFILETTFFVGNILFKVDYSDTSRES